MKTNFTMRCALVAMTLLVGIAAEASAQEAPASPTVTVTEGRVTLNVVEQDISVVLRLLAEAQRVNIIAGPDVVGAVTVNLYDVPLEDALNAVVSVTGFSWYRTGEIIYVTTDEQRGTMAPGVGNMKVATFQLNHVEAEPLVEMIKQLSSKGGKVMVGVNRSVVAMDTPDRIAIFTDLVKQLDQPKRQVLIKVHIITVQRNDNLAIGTGFDLLPMDQYNIEAVANGFAQPFPPRPDPETGLVDQEAIPDGTGLFTGTLQSDFRAFIEALDRVTDVEILASPQLLALDGEVAHLQVGDRLGFRVTTTTDTASLESVEFLEVGTVLDLTPTISNDGTVQLEVTPKVSSGSISDDGLPNESTTEVNTNMQVRDGQTVIIGGLLNATRRLVKSQIPFLGDLPLLGKLFGRSTWTDDQSEVVVFLTPTIMDGNPTPEMALKTEDAKQRWQPLEEKGLITPETTPVKNSPSRRWRDFLKQRGAMSVQGAPDFSAGEDTNASPTAQGAKKP